MINQISNSNEQFTHILILPNTILSVYDNLTSYSYRQVGTNHSLINLESLSEFWVLITVIKFIREFIIRTTLFN